MAELSRFDEPGAPTTKRRVSPRRHHVPIVAAGHAEQAESSANPQPKPSFASASRPRVLYIEDNRENQILAQAILNKHYDVQTAGNSEEALRMARDGAFDLFLIDIHLGAGPNGMDVMQALREDPAYRHTPMIACTAYTLPGDRERMLRHGFDEYLAKPYRKEQLLETIGQALSS